MLITKRLVNKYAKNHGVCSEGKDAIKYFKEKYPKGIEITEENIEKFFGKKLEDGQYIGTVLQGIFLVLGQEEKAKDFNRAFTWKTTSRKIMLKKFWSLYNRKEKE